MTEEYPALRQAPRPAGHDEILVQDSGDQGADLPGHVPDIEQDECEEGQGKVPEVIRQRRQEAGRRVATHAARGEERDAIGEEHQHEHPDPPRRQAVQEHGQGRDCLVQGLPPVTCRPQADKAAQQRHQKGLAAEERQGVGQGLEEDLRHFVAAGA